MADFQPHQPAAQLVQPITADQTAPHTANYDNHDVQGSGIEFPIDRSNLYKAAKHDEMAEPLERSLEDFDCELRQQLSYALSAADTVEGWLFFVGSKGVRPLRALLTGGGAEVLTKNYW